MADDAQITVTLVTYDSTTSTPTPLPLPFYATKDNAGNYTMQSTPRVNGAQVDSTNPMPTQETTAPSGPLNNQKGTMTTTAQIVVPFRAGRKWVMFTNQNTTGTQDLGAAGVLSGGGIPLQPTAGFLFTEATGAAGPIYGVSSSIGSAYSWVDG